MTTPAAAQGARAGLITLRVRCATSDGMLTRLAATLGPHPVDHLTYDAAPDGRVEAVVGLTADAWQQRRVAAKLRRLVGVVDVVAEAAHDGS
ncbi:hypothetical protein JQN72_09815 [Phycicoccus sp. CSK15P-2]|uniref:hypothetical protein n=1 Tax=Phycicoccus sp. CSK15P-2 TaxID=2807627 RepID=UPI00194E370B|nr:hypothetical protein [Phycicoccus sp. CSK15P-2]MBM6404535.1 hypothetical protein [Phycicoccus sp. CSK15P-2]